MFSRYKNDECQKRKQRGQDYKHGKQMPRQWRSVFLNGRGNVRAKKTQYTFQVKERNNFNNRQ
jgi:hypothetical protein